MYIILFCSLYIPTHRPWRPRRRPAKHDRARVVHAPHWDRRAPRHHAPTLPWRSSTSSPPPPSSPRIFLPHAVSYVKSAPGTKKGGAASSSSGACDSSTATARSNGGILPDEVRKRSPLSACAPVVLPSPPATTPSMPVEATAPGVSCSTADLSPSTVGCGSGGSDAPPTPAATRSLPPPGGTGSTMPREPIHRSDTDALGVGRVPRLAAPTTSSMLSSNSSKSIPGNSQSVLAGGAPLMPPLPPTPVKQGVTSAAAAATAAAAPDLEARPTDGGTSVPTASVVGGAFHAATAAAATLGAVGLVPGIAQWLDDGDAGQSPRPDCSAGVRGDRGRSDTPPSLSVDGRPSNRGGGGPFRPVSAAERTPVVAARAATRERPLHATAATAAASAGSVRSTEGDAAHLLSDATGAGTSTASAGGRDTVATASGTEVGMMARAPPGVTGGTGGGTISTAMEEGDGALSGRLTATGEATAHGTATASADECLQTAATDDSASLSVAVAPSTATVDAVCASSPVRAEGAPSQWLSSTAGAIVGVGPITDGVAGALGTDWLLLPLPLLTPLLLLAAPRPPRAPRTPPASRLVGRLLMTTRRPAELVTAWWVRRWWSMEERQANVAVQPAAASHLYGFLWASAEPAESKGYDTRKKKKTREEMHEKKTSESSSHVHSQGQGNCVLVTGQPSLRSQRKPRELYVTLSYPTNLPCSSWSHRQLHPPPHSVHSLLTSMLYCSNLLPRMQPHMDGQVVPPRRPKDAACRRTCVTTRHGSTATRPARRRGLGPARRFGRHGRSATGSDSDRRKVPPFETATM